MKITYLAILTLASPSSQWKIISLCEDTRLTNFGLTTKNECISYNNTLWWQECDGVWVAEEKDPNRIELILQAEDFLEAHTLTYVQCMRVATDRRTHQLVGKRV